MPIQLEVQVWKAGRMCLSTHQSMMVHWLDGGKTEIYVQQSMLNEDSTLGGRTKRSLNSSFHHRYVATPLALPASLYFLAYATISSLLSVVQIKAPSLYAELILTITLHMLGHQDCNC